MVLWVGRESESAISREFSRCDHRAGSKPNKAASAQFGDICLQDNAISFDNSPSLIQADIRRKCKLIRQALVVVILFSKFRRHLEDDSIELLDTVLQIKLIVQNAVRTVLDKASFLLVHFILSALKLFLFEN